MLEGEGDLVREVPGGVEADQHDVLVLCGETSSESNPLHIYCIRLKLTYQGRRGAQV